jgi:hypothetical protein
MKVAMTVLLVTQATYKGNIYVLLTCSFRVGYKLRFLFAIEVFGLHVLSYPCNISLQPGYKWA